MRPEDVLEGWVGARFDYEILQANPWTANFVVAQRYRKGRAILAGDSAHQFIPTGGYGMNSGIADAAGLSWVLAACVQGRSEEHTSELQSLMRISYAVFCLKKKTIKIQHQSNQKQLNIRH